MIEIAHSIDLKLRERLEDPETRKAFFLAESSALIASQLIKLRKQRGRNQTQLAEAVGTQQPAISRMERADYQNWSFSALRRIADELDARIRVLIEPSEDILKEYEGEAKESPVEPEGEAQEAAQSQYMSAHPVPLISLDEWNKGTAWFIGGSHLGGPFALTSLHVAQMIAPSAGNVAVAPEQMVPLSQLLSERATHEQEKIELRKRAERAEQLLEQELERRVRILGALTQGQGISAGQEQASMSAGAKHRTKAPGPYENRVGNQSVHQTWSGA